MSISMIAKVIFFFQKRSATKKHFPGMLHFTIGGHIDAWEEVIDAALREWQEEIWITLDSSKLEFIGKFHQQAIHLEYNLSDNEIAFDYAYCFDWNLNQLTFEDGEVIWIESVDIDILLSLSYDQYKDMNIVPYEFYPKIFQWIKEHVS